MKVGFDKAKGFLPLKPVLLVFLEHLHQQWAEDAWSKTHVRLLKLDCQDTLSRLTRGGLLPLAPGWYLTSYTQLASNKVGSNAGLDEVLLNGQELAIHITEEGEMERCFMDARHRAADVQADRAGSARIASWQEDTEGTAGLQPLTARADWGENGFPIGRISS